MKLFTSISLLPLGAWLMTVQGRCLYGEGCYFPCNCANQTECEAGCRSGHCDTNTGVYNVSWTGPSCLIGNVAYGRTAPNDTKQSSDASFSPDLAVDGNPESPPGSHKFCAHPKPADGNPTNPADPAWWWVDLGSVHKIYDITIYGRTGCGGAANCTHRLDNFVLLVGNESNYRTGDLCANYTDGPIPLGGNKTFPCPTPLYGTHVFFQRTGGYQPGITSICEVIVTGHEYIDCSSVQCHEGPCSEVTGCTSCLGTYRPHCVDECAHGYYGVNCVSVCGNCSSPDTCGKNDGTCLNGCQLWWADQKCTTYIVPPDVEDETSYPGTTNDDSVLVEWEALTSVPTELSQYYKYRVTYPAVNLYTTEGPLINHTAGVLSYEVTGLTYNTEYNFTVDTYRVMDGTADPGESYQPITVKTACTNPKQPVILSTEALNGTEEALGAIVVTYEIPMNNESGCDSITEVFIAYRHNDSDEFTRDPGDLSNNTHEIKPTKGGEHEIKVEVANNEDVTSSSPSDFVEVPQTTPIPPVGPNVVAIVVPIVLIVVIAAVLVGVYFYKRNSRDQDSEHDVKPPGIPHGKPASSKHFDKEFMGIDETLQDQDDTTTTARVRGSTNLALEVDNTRPEDPVSLAKFESFVTHKKNIMAKFEAEYESLPQEDLTRCIIAQTSDNLKRNRYKNVYAYDANRVILKPTHADEPDYINANYIRGYNREKEYIATQGPKENTVVEFWRMIWQEKANLIAMVANKMENGKKKCCHYWPENAGESLTFDRFTITTEAVEHCADYASSILSLRCERETMTVRHFHFKTWEDKSMPIYGLLSLLAFTRRVYSFDHLRKGPMVVHCSAGVGRTGTCIVMDILRHQALNEGALNVYDTVRGVRLQRMNMVQTKDQYFFIHDALVEYIKCSETAVSCVDFEKEIGLLNKVVNGKSKIEQQWEALHGLLKPMDNALKEGFLPENINKNRNTSVIPANNSRPFLPGRESESYINAVFVDSYKNHDSYIVTQLPLENTIGDFWRLVHTQEITSIIMLNKVTDVDEYWPSAERQTTEYCGINVTLAETEQIDRNIVCRTFSVEKLNKRAMMPQAPLVVRQWQLLSWPDHLDLPSHPGHLVDLSEHATHWQQQNSASKTTGNTIVQCLDGVSHSGLYCGLMFVLDRMKMEQEVDPFIAIRCVSRHRPEFFKSLEQYKFLYKMGRDYMAQYSTYANLQ